MTKEESANFDRHLILFQKFGFFYCVPPLISFIASLLPLFGVHDDTGCTFGLIAFLAVFFDGAEVWLRVYTLSVGVAMAAYFVFFTLKMEKGKLYGLLANVILFLADTAFCFFLYGYIPLYGYIIRLVLHVGFAVIFFLSAYHYHAADKILKTAREREK